jgi:hypothetical protein
MSEETIATQEFQVERKTIRLALKENVRGRFLRITETVGGKHDTIIIPDTGLAELSKARRKSYRPAVNVRRRQKRKATTTDRWTADHGTGGQRAEGGKGCLVLLFAGKPVSWCREYGTRTCVVLFAIETEVRAHRGRTLGSELGTGSIRPANSV